MLLRDGSRVFLHQKRAAPRQLDLTACRLVRPSNKPSYFGASFFCLVPNHHNTQVVVRYRIMEMILVTSAVASCCGKSVCFSNLCASRYSIVVSTHRYTVSPGRTMARNASIRISNQP